MRNHRIVIGLLLGLFALGAAAPLVAQDSKEEIKKRILKKVEEYLKREEQRILKEIEKIIDEELARAEREKPKPEKKQGYLGVGIAELSEDDREELGLRDDEGIVVTQVREGFPAAKAGLQEGDVILRVGRTRIGDIEALLDVLKKEGAGATITVRILRGDERKRVRIELVERPGEEPREERQPRREPGVEPRRVTEDDSSTREKMRKRIREFMKNRGERKDPKDEPEAAAPPPPRDAPARDGEVDAVLRRVDEWLASDEVQKVIAEVVEQLEEMGMDPARYVKKNDKGNWRLTRAIRKRFHEHLESFSPENLEKKVETMRKYLEEHFELELPKLPSARPAPVPSAAKRSDVPGTLGIMVGELKDEMRAQFDLEEDVGLVITAIRDGSPASKGGVQKGDVLLKIDDAWVRGERHLARIMKRARAGESMRLTLLSGGKEKTVRVTLAPKP